MSTIVSVATRFVEERERLGFRSASAVAKALVLTQQGVSKVESGASTPGGELLARAARLGMDIQYVLTGTRSGGVDLTLLGMCEAALQSTYAGIRPGRSASGAIRLSALSKVYNELQAKLGPDVDVPAATRKAAADYIAWVDDPADPALLERALFRDPISPKTNAGVIADRGSIASGGDLNIGDKSGWRGKK